MRSLQLKPDSTDLNNILKNPITFLTYSMLFAADDFEDFQKFKYLAMFSNVEMYAQLEGLDRNSDTKRTIGRNVEDPSIRQEQINKDIKEVFGTDFQSLSGDALPESDGIIEL